MTRKGWKAFKRKKILFLSEKQRKARLRFAKKCVKLTAEDWDKFLFTDECPKCLFQCPNHPKKRYLTFVQEGSPAHTSMATQTWSQKNLPNFKDGWPANFHDLNPVKNILVSLTRQRTKIQPQNDERTEKAKAKGTRTFYG